MAHALSIKAGSSTWTLSEMLRLTPGEGFDPADNDFLQPQFGESMGEGRPLISLDEGNRELAFPLSINPAKAATAWHPYYENSTLNSKPNLHKLVSMINRLLRDTTEVRWTDDGGGVETTYHDVTFARLEPDYNFRRGQHQYLNAVLRVWTRPYAHTGTSRIIGTGAATGGRNVRLYTALPTNTGATQLAWPTNAIRGDAPAQISLEVSSVLGPTSGIMPAGTVGASQALVGITLGNPDQSPNLNPKPAANLSGQAATLIGASGAMASQARRFGVTPTTLEANQSLNIGYIDGRRTRVILLARSNVPSGLASGMALWMAHHTGAPLGATAFLPNGRQWRTIDLGVVSVPTVTAAAFSPQLRAGLPGATAAGASSTLDVAGMITLDEERSLAVMLPLASALATSYFPAASIALDGTTDTFTWQWGPSGQAYGGILIDKHARGEMPTLKPWLSREVIDVFAIPDDGPQNNAMAAALSVRERFTYSR